MARARIVRTSTLLLLGGATVVALPRRTVWADAPPPTAAEELPTKKPMYSKAQNATTRPKPAVISDPLSHEKSTIDHPTPTDRLQGQIKRARLFLHDQTVAAENAFSNGLTWAFRKETNIANTVASLAPSAESGEQLLPGAIYVLVATMAGSIVSRNRGIFLRATVPLAVGITAGWMLIPVTMRNASDLIWEYEKKVPAVSETHAQISGFVKEAWGQAKTQADAASKWADNKAGDSRKSIEKWVGEGR